ncbi:MAG TPA: BolA/IbaG family iron-sulfur metabolism protein [Pseudobdellovibrionaceae bacterium]|nr:BolA/IbaG family iron-sulfur metabolism protein [Pseudobdellovibrionaceae bacterium]
MSPQEIKTRLEQAYPGANVEVFDLTGTEDHYEVSVESPVFAGLSRIQQHQHVMAVFGPELKTGEVHALSIKTKIKS